jgi:membrane-associated PAP2 superfamily phosphatase
VRPALWLAGGAAGRAAFGGAQYLRGAHYPSHTLWTAWLCWVLSAALLARPARPHPRD